MRNKQKSTTFSSWLEHELVAIQDIQTNPYNIKNYHKPSVSLQILAVDADPKTLRLINNPDHKVILHAVRLLPHLITYKAYRTYESVKTAIDTEPTVVALIKDLDEHFQRYVYETYPHVAHLIINPTDPKIKVYQSLYY